MFHALIHVYISYKYVFRGNAELLPRMDANCINITVTSSTILHSIYIGTISYDSHEYE